MPEQKTKSYFKTWYKKHKDAYNQKRQERYQTDPTYRDKQVENSRNQRERVNSRRAKIVSYTIGKAAELVGRDAQTIRLWCKNGLIPEMSDGHKHRIFLPHHIELMRELAAYLDTWTPSKAVEYRIGLKALVERIKEKW